MVLPGRQKNPTINTPRVCSISNIMSINHYSVLIRLNSSSCSLYQYSCSESKIRSANYYMTEVYLSHLLLIINSTSKESTQQKILLNKVWRRKKSLTTHTRKNTLTTHTHIDLNRSTAPLRAGKKCSKHT